MPLHTRQTTVLGLAITAVLAAAQAPAQTVTPGELPEVVVTARQRAERIEDVPATVRAFTDTDIQSAGIERPTDFIELTPNVSQVQTAEAGDMQVVIRGINTGRDAETNFALVVDGVLYALGPNRAVVALDAATGRQIWSHPVEGSPAERGINYWESKDRADRRLIFTANSYLQEINARTGVTINTFGKDGRVDLREGLGRDPKSIRNIQSKNPGRVFENLVILGSVTGEGFGSAVSARNSCLTASDSA